MARPQQATVEDYHSSDSDHDGGLEFRRTPVPAPPNANVEANVAAKRSYPSDMDKSPPVAEKVANNIDLHSDSGYSSHTAATMSSADSGPSAHSQTLSPPTPPESAASAPASSPADRRRPALTKEDRHSSTGSSRKPLARAGSVQSRSRPTRDRRSTITAEDVQVVDCADPHCKECVRAGSRGRRPRPVNRDSGLDMSTLSLETPSQRSDPSSYAPPQSPMYTQPEYRQGYAVVQPAQSTRPRRSSSVNRTRPISFAGDVPPNYSMPGMTGYSNPGAGAPMAYYNQMPMHQPQMAGYGTYGTPPGTYPYHQMQHQYDLQRPQLPHQSSSTYNARHGRPVSQYGTPLLTQESENMPSARYPSNAPSSAAQPKFPLLRSPESDYSDSESDEEVENDRRLMPPPSSKPQRPRLAQPNSYTSERSERSERRKSLMSQTLTLESQKDRERNRDRASRLTTDAQSRRGSVSRSRPALNLVQHPQAQSAYETPSRKVIVEPAKSSRRRSYQYGGAKYLVEPERPSKTYVDGVGLSGHRRRITDDDIQLRADRNRRTPVYEDDDEGFIKPSRRRRQTEADVERIEQSGRTKLRDTTNDVEAYLRNTRGSELPLNDHVHNAALRGARVPSGHSDAGSSRSKGSGKESRASHSNRTTVTNGGSNEIRLQIDQSSGPVKLQFADFEGRTLRFDPSEGGKTNIVIADARGNENTYHSERGSVHGSSRRTVVSRSEKVRRDPDEDSIKSSQSSQLRRQRERERGIRDRERDYELEQQDWEEETRPLRRKGEARDLRYQELRYHR